MTQLLRSGSGKNERHPSAPPVSTDRCLVCTCTKIDKSQLAIAEPKRLRDKRTGNSSLRNLSHLRAATVRSPSLRFAQPRAIALKVREFTCRCAELTTDNCTKPATRRMVEGPTDRCTGGRESVPWEQRRSMSST